jgi:hypothetical protein
MLINLKKYFVTLLIALVANSTWAQISPSTCPPTVFSGVFSAGAQNNSALYPELNTVDVSSTCNYDVKGVYSVHMAPGNHAGNFTTGTFHAGMVAPSPVDVVSFHANGFNGIPLYDKFELGIKLPLDLTTKIDNFFGNNNHVKDNIGTEQNVQCQNGYGNGFLSGPNTVNPYDPDQISLEATFSFPNKPSQTVYGFYYREYSYSGNTINPDYSNVKYIENTGLQYHWRVRFAPKYIGMYTVTWKITTSSGTVINYQDNIGQTFTTVSSNSKGFVKMGSTGRFLVTQPDPSQAPQTILPIGFVTSPSDGIGGSGGIGLEDCPTWGCLSMKNSSFPSNYIKHRRQVKSKIPQKGVTRVFSHVEQYSIEWEKAGVYDADPNKPIDQNVDATKYYIDPGQHVSHYHGMNRQAIMWEMDSLLENAKAKDIYIQWILEDNINGLCAAGTPTNYYWAPQTNLQPVEPFKNGNPYYHILSNPPVNNSCYQFFSDSNAIKYYKNRLRYIIARYGYSTNILTFETFNEVDFLDDWESPNTTTFLDNYVKPWLTTMLDYVKGSTGLNHNDHLWSLTVEEGTGFSSVNNLDFTTTHPYILSARSFKQAFVRVQARKSQFGKPCQPSELGIDPNLNAFPEFMNPTYHTLLWSTAFIGGLTTGIEMWSPGLNIDPQAPTSHPCGGDGYTPHFKPFQAFINNINFNAGNYFPRYYPDNTEFDYNKEAFYLVDNGGWNGSNAVGYIRNEGFWWYGFTNSSSDLYNSTSANAIISEYNALPWKPAYFPTLPSNHPILAGDLGYVTIKGLQASSNYFLEWYNTYKDPAIENNLILQTTTTTDPYGQVLIKPPYGFGGGCDKHEFGFKIRPYLQPKDAYSLGNLYADSTLYNIDKPESETVLNNNIIVYPNPSSDKLYIKYNKEIFNQSRIELYDLRGRLVQKQDNTNELNTSQIENGAYMLKFISGDVIKTFKINILH